MADLRWSRLAGIVVGYLADVLFGDPQRGHPVAGFGRCAAVGEALIYRDGRAAGTVHTAVLIGGLAGVGVLGQRAAGRGPGLVALTAAATWVALGGTTLARTGAGMADLLEAGDIAGARQLLPSLCGRDPAALDSDGLVRAACESVAENTSDAQVAPLLWAACAGVPGVLVYRGINTLDAMVGNRSPRYHRFGWAAARLDDLVNFAAARATAAITVVCAVDRGLAGRCAAGLVARRGAPPQPERRSCGGRVRRRLGVRLGGPTQYRHELENRPTLGDGVRPGVSDLRRAVRLSRLVQLGALTAAVAISAAGRTDRRVSLRR